MQVTRHGGLATFESSDGRFLYYVKENQNGIWRMPTSGGEPAIGRLECRKPTMPGNLHGLPSVRGDFPNLRGAIAIR